MTLWIRCDADTTMGVGHFYRQLSLAQRATERGIDARFFLHESSLPFTFDLLEREGIEAIALTSPRASRDEVEAMRRALDGTPGATLILDGYHFDMDYVRAARAAARLVYFDDDGRLDAPVDVMINVNLGAFQIDYAQIPGDPVRLLGTDYTLLRPQFRALREVAAARVISKEITRALVTMGGSDVTEEITTALHGLANTSFEGRADVVISARASNLDALHALAKTLPFECVIHTHVEEMAELMVEQDIALCSAGGTSWELCALGVPMLQVKLFDNQSAVHASLVEAGISLSMGDRATYDAASVARAFELLAADPTRRIKMKRAGQELIDGRGADRTLDVIYTASLQAHG